MVNLDIYTIQRLTKPDSLTLELTDYSFVSHTMGIMNHGCLFKFFKPTIALNQRYYVSGMGEYLGICMLENKTVELTWGKL